MFNNGQCAKCTSGNAPVVREREYIDGDYWCTVWHCLSCGVKEENRTPRLGTPAWHQYEKQKEEERQRVTYIHYRCQKCKAHVRTIGGTPLEAWCGVCKRWMDFEITKGDNGNEQVS